MTGDIFLTNRKERAAMPNSSYVVTLYQKLSFLPFLCRGLGAQCGGMRKEFIFIDDGSSDGTPEALRERIASWPEVLIIRQRNTGSAPALNRGLALARGRYIKPMDGDDILLPWASERMLRAMLGAKADAALGQGDERSIYAPAETRADDIAPLPAPDEIPAAANSLLEKRLRCTQASLSQWMFEATLLPQIKGCDPSVFIQNYSQELEIALASKVAIVRGLLLLIPASAPGRFSDNEGQILHDINLALLRFWRRHPDLSLRLRRFALQRAVQRAASWTFRRGGANLLHPVSLLRVPAALGLLKPDLAVHKQVCDVFRATHSIRPMPGADQV